MALLRAQSAFDAPAQDRQVSLLRSQCEQLQLEAGALKEELADERNKVKAERKRAAGEAKTARDEEAAKAEARGRELKRK